MTSSTFGSTTEAIKDTINGAVGSIDANRKPLANGLDSAASTLQSGADTLENTAAYIRKHKVGDMFSDIGGLVKKYPTAAIIGAVVVGIYVGRMLPRR